LNAKLNATSERRLESVTRRYRPGAAALDELVEVLYRLLMDAPAIELVTAPTLPESTCFSVVQE
jgi:hypothetical protein